MRPTYAESAPIPIDTTWVQRNAIAVGVAIYLAVAAISLLPSILDRYYLKHLSGPELYRAMESVNAFAPFHLKPAAVFLVFGAAQYVYLIPAMLVLVVIKQYRVLKVVAICSGIVFLLNATACGVMFYGLSKIG